MKGSKKACLTLDKALSIAGIIAVGIEVAIVAYHEYGKLRRRVDALSEEVAGLTEDVESLYDSCDCPVECDGCCDVCDCDCGCSQYDEADYIDDDCQDACSGEGGCDA